MKRQRCEAATTTGKPCDELPAKLVTVFGQTYPMCNRHANLTKKLETKDTIAPVKVTFSELPKERP